MILAQSALFAAVFIMTVGLALLGVQAAKKRTRLGQLAAWLLVTLGRGAVLACAVHLDSCWDDLNAAAGKFPMAFATFSLSLLFILLFYVTTSLRLIDKWIPLELQKYSNTEETRTLRAGFLPVLPLLLDGLDDNSASLLFMAALGISFWLTGEYYFAIQWGTLLGLLILFVLFCARVVFIMLLGWLALLAAHLFCIIRRRIKP